MQLVLPSLRLPHGRRDGVSRIKTTIMAIQAHLGTCVGTTLLGEFGVIGIATETHGDGWRACGRGAARSAG